MRDRNVNETHVHGIFLLLRIHCFTALIETHSVKPAKCPTREAQTLEQAKDGTVLSSLMSEVGGSDD